MQVIKKYQQSTLHSITSLQLKFLNHVSRAFRSEQNYNTFFIETNMAPVFLACLSKTVSSERRLACVFHNVRISLLLEQNDTNLNSLIYWITNITASF